jgi:DNA-binding transcriptional LysR family regulator
MQYENLRSFRRPNLDQLRTFVVVAEELHFGRAAKRLHMASSPVSRKIKELEASLGVSLFERHTRNVHLSEAGADLLPAVRELLSKLDELQWQAARREEPLEEPVHVGLGCGTHPAERAALIAAVRAAYGVRVLVDVGTTYPLLDRLHSGELLCATLHRPFPTDGVGIACLSSEEMGIVLAADHPLAQRAQLTVSDLRALRYVTHRRFPEWEEILETIGITEIVDVGSDFVTDSAALVATNTDYFGLSVFNPDSPMHRPYDDPGVVMRPCVDLGLEMPTDLVWLEARASSDPRLRSVVRSLQANVRIGTAPAVA